MDGGRDKVALLVILWRVTIIETTLCGAWRRIGRVDAFRPEGRGFESRSSRQVGRDLGQVLHLQLPVSLRRVNSDTVSIAVVGSRERF